MTTLRLRTFAAAAGLLLALVAAGCGGRGDIDEVKVGQSPTDVDRIMGEPVEKVYGEATDTGKVLWIYPQGKVLFVNWSVAQIEKSQQ